jgi:anti-sigma regulatory factor (Ser/Thr protein kinase)
MFYGGTSAFLAGVMPFIREGLEASEPFLVVVEPIKIELIREELGGDVSGLRFEDMVAVGRNPARIIPVWRQFVAERIEGNHTVRGIGEPIGPHRGTEELAECYRHESLLNLAFDAGAPWQLLCPYDTEALPSDVVEEARRTHPLVRQDGLSRQSPSYIGRDRAARALQGRLPEPATPVEVLAFDAGSLATVRMFIWGRARDAGLHAVRAGDLVLAIDEVATNSVRHGGGAGRLRVWRDDAAIICEVRDQGHFESPLVGREIPTTDLSGGRGLWLVNQLCDLVQIRSLDSGAVVRVHMRLPSGAAT